MRPTTAAITTLASSTKTMVLSMAVWPSRVRADRASASSATTASIQGVPSTLAA